VERLSLSKSYLLGIDIGTAGAKSVIFNLSGNWVSRGYVEYPVSMPKSGWAEQDPNTWWRSAVESLRIAIRKATIPADEIVCVGLSSQINSPSFIGEDGNPLRSSILWMDRRADPQATWVRQKIGEEKICRITGVKVDSFYSYCKLLWVKENQPKIWEQTKVILQPKDYIGFKLTGECVLDKALASSSGLLDTRRGHYAISLLEEMNIPTEKLPRLVPSTEVIGKVTEEAADQTGLASGIPVITGSGDVIVNAVGSGVVKTGLAYNKTATASDIVICVDHPIFDSRFRMVSYAHALPKKWLLVGGAGGGICYRWFRDTFSQSEVEVAKRLNKDPYEIMDAEAQQVKPGSENLIFLPHLMGARSPVWDTKARGVYFGININHDKRHFIRAVMEGVAFSVRHRIEIIEKDLGVDIEEVRVVGGGARSPLWRRIMADVYNKPIVLPGGEDQECLGAAILAGVGVGLYKDAIEASNKAIPVVDRLEPMRENREKYERLYRVYAGLYHNLKDSFDMLFEA